MKDARSPILLPFTVFLLLLSFCSSAETENTLLDRTDSGDAQSQLELGIHYKNEGNTGKAHFWFLKSSLQGNTEALSEMGELFENSPHKAYDTLTLAENWYLTASEQGLGRADEGYARVLEQKFNRRRARQVSSITILDDQIDEDISQDEALSSFLPDSKQGRTYTEQVFTLFVLVLFILFFSLRRVIRLRRNVKREDLGGRISEQQRQIRTLQKHLSAAHSQLKKQQTEQKRTLSDQTLNLACAALGFHPDSIPEEKEIKLRYKKLSRIYHPDTIGSDAEMKRLNAAVKIISQYIRRK